MNAQSKRQSLAVSVALAALLTSGDGARAGRLEDEIFVGDPEHFVTSVLGPPSGYISSGSYELRRYDRGKVILRDGRVVEVQLVSQEEADRQRAEEARLREEQQAAASAEAARLRTEGEALRDRTFADPAFQALPASRQLVFWNTFRKRYPMVAIDAMYATALAGWRKEQEDIRVQAQVLAMQRRVAVAEQRAAEAERRAEEARRSIRYETACFTSYDWPIMYQWPVQFFQADYRPRPRVVVAGGHRRKNAKRGSVIPGRGGRRGVGTRSGRARR